MKFFILFAVLVYTINCRHIKIWNNCPITVWAGFLFPDNQMDGGVKLEAGKEHKFDDVPDFDYDVMIWPRTYCNETTMWCYTGRCGKDSTTKVGCDGYGPNFPVTKAYLKLKADGGDDKYWVTLEEGFNLPIQIQPFGVDCEIAGGCSDKEKNVNEACPRDFAIKLKSAVTVGCKSGCDQRKTPEECCTGKFSGSKCNPRETAPLFAKSCPKMLTHKYDKEEKKSTCVGATYLVQFC